MQPGARGTATDPGRPAGGEPSAGVPRCTGVDLAASLPGAPTGGTEQQKIHVRFTNRSSTACSRYGYPGARLRSRTGDTWDLARSSLVEPTRIILASGQQAYATLAYLPTDPTDGTGNPVFAPVSLILTPPDERASLSIPWTRGPVLRQDGATHPGTYISALEPGG